MVYTKRFQRCRGQVTDSDEFPFERVEPFFSPVRNNAILKHFKNQLYRY